MFYAWFTCELHLFSILLSSTLSMFTQLQVNRDEDTSYYVVIHPDESLQLYNSIIQLVHNVDSTN